MIAEQMEPFSDELKDVILARGFNAYWILVDRFVCLPEFSKAIGRREREIQKSNTFHFQVSARLVSTSRISMERFGASDGSSGWKWDKGGVGMGGKDAGN